MAGKIPLGGRRPAEAGNIVLELALALPFLLLLIAGILDLGLLYWEKHILIGASREGARAAAQPGSGGAAAKTRSEVRQIVQDYLNRFNLKDPSGNPLTLNDQNFTYTWATTSYGRSLSVELNPIPVRMLLLPNAQTIWSLFSGKAGGIPATINLSARTTMAAEWSTPPGP